MARRSSSFASTLLLGVAAWVMISNLAPVFVGLKPTTKSMRGSKSVMKGFAEEFAEWRNGLTSEEKALMQEQSSKRYDKKYLKTEDAEKDAIGTAEGSNPKLEKFASIVAKFIDEQDGDEKAKRPQYDALIGSVKSAGADDKSMEVSPNILMIDREADRKYAYVMKKINDAEAEGKNASSLPCSNGRMETFGFDVSDAKAKELALKIFKKALEGAKDEMVPTFNNDGLDLVGDNMINNKKTIQDIIDKIEKDGQFEVRFPDLVVRQGVAMALKFQKDVAAARNASTLDEKAMKEKFLKEWEAMTKQFFAEVKEVNDAAEKERMVYEESKGSKATQADVLKEVWQAINDGKIIVEGGSKDKLPPLDEELLAELAEKPVQPVNSYGYGKKLWKSEARDTFGAQFLIGVYDTYDEAYQAYGKWKAAFDQNKQNVRSGFEQYKKEENARLDKDTSARDRLLTLLEDSRQSLYR